MKDSIIKIRIFRFIRGFTLKICLFFILLSLPLFFKVGLANQINQIQEKKELAIQAILAECEWCKDHTINATILENSYFKNCEIFQIVITKRISPTPMLRVAVDNDNNTFIFPAYKTYEHFEKFSKLIKKEKINLDEGSLPQYINSVLFLLDHDSKSISSINEIENELSNMPPDVSKEIQSDLPKLKEIVKPPDLKIKERNAKIIFYSWDRHGFLNKWTLLTLMDGEIISCNVCTSSEHLRQVL